MSTPAFHSLPIIYREYSFPENFPVLLMRSPVSSSRLADFLHFHNSIEIAYCQNGIMSWNLENRSYTLTPGDAFFLPPFYTHSSTFPDPDETSCCYYLFLNPEDLLAPFYPNGIPQEFLWYRYSDFPKFFSRREFPDELQLIRMIIQEFPDDSIYSRQSIRGLVETLLALLHRRFQDSCSFAQADSRLPMLIPAFSWLDREFTADPDTDHLAQLCGLSKARFLQEFRRCSHQTPIQYVRSLRVQKACQLLTSTENGILDIALQTGFQSVSSFNRQFRQYLGCSPQVFRNARRSIIKKNPLYDPYTPQ